MISTRWRTLCFVLGAMCTALLWRDCSRTPTDPRPAAVDCPRADSAGQIAPAVLERSSDPADPPDRGPSPEAIADGGLALYGFKIPGWVFWFAPQPGEDLRSYRDRMLPLALAAIGPQRARVARSRDSFAALVSLDARQRAELEAATQETAAALQDRVMTAVLSGELFPASFKPMAAVHVARDLLEIVTQGNRRFLDALRDDQRAALEQQPFDFGDYLVFSTHWEDALKLL